MMLSSGLFAVSVVPAHAVVCLDCDVLMSGCSDASLFVPAGTATLTTGYTTRITPTPWLGLSRVGTSRTASSAWLSLRFGDGCDFSEFSAWSPASDWVSKSSRRTTVCHPWFLASFPFESLACITHHRAVSAGFHRLNPQLAIQRARFRFHPRIGRNPCVGWIAVLGIVTIMTHIRMTRGSVPCVPIKGRCRGLGTVPTVPNRAGFRLPPHRSNLSAYLVVPTLSGK